MSGPEFFQTEMGQRFFTSTMPRIADALEQIVERQERVRKSRAAVEMPLPSIPSSTPSLDVTESEKIVIGRLCTVLRNAPHAFIDKIADSMLPGYDSWLDDETCATLVQLVRAARGA